MGLTNEKRLLDDGAIAKLFPEIFDAFSYTAAGKYVYICNMENDFSYWSPEAVDFFGLPSSWMYHAGDIWTEHIDPADREAYVANINDLFEGRIDTHDIIYRARAKNGEYVTCACKGVVIKNEEGAPKYFAGTIINYENSDAIDSITGLYSRNHLLNQMEDARKQEKPYYLLIFGVRNFFDVNTSYGYHFGNKVLKAMAEFGQSIRKDTVLFRPEGTKGIAIIGKENHDVESIKRAYDMLREYYHSSLEVEGIHVSIDICGGLMLVDDFSVDANTVYNNALFALDHAKRDGCKELLMVDRSLFSGNQKHLRILKEIRKSIDDNFRGFYLCYQPIVDAKSEQVTGMESLLRWKSEEYGVVPPNEFIPWLERDPLFFELGNWILHQAMHDTKQILEMNPNFVVNVNLAYPQLQRAEFKSVLSKIISDEQFPADNLKLELTERCRMLDTDMLFDDMSYFKEEGMQTALDDFGTGYAALNLLTELPVDQIKIDKSFIDDIETDRAKQSLLRAVTECANELGKTVCVEGVETDSMAKYLRTRFRTNYFQGYYYSRPVPIEDFIRWMKEYEKA